MEAKGDLDPQYQPCLRSGHCCKSGPCAFGERDPGVTQCKFLEVEFRHGDVEIHRCGKYEEIMALPPEAGARFNPAFGAGCCQPLFNEPRERIIRALMAKTISLTVLDDTGKPVKVGA